MGSAACEVLSDEALALSPTAGVTLSFSLCPPTQLLSLSSSKQMAPSCLRAIAPAVSPA